MLTPVKYSGYFTDTDPRSIDIDPPLDFRS